MRSIGTYPWGVVAAVLVLVAGSLGAQMAYSPNHQMIAGDRNLAFNRTGISVDQRNVYERNLLGPLEASGLNLMSMMFHVLVLEDKNQTPEEDEFDATSLVWEGGVEAIDTPVGVFHLGVDPEGTTVRLDRYEHPGSTREPETIESLSVGSLLDAIQSGRQIEYSEKGFTLILTFTEANLDLNDGRIRSLHARVLRSRR